jgi:hypothetical protein
MSILPYSSYSQARGGHALGDVREAFGDAVGAFAAWQDGAPEPSIDVRGQSLTIRQVCGLLWNCSDIAPGMLFDEVCDLVGFGDNPPRRRTYGCCARTLAGLYDEAVRDAA